MKILKLNSCDSCPGNWFFDPEGGRSFHCCEYALFDHPDTHPSQFEIKGTGPDTIPDFCPLPDDVNQEILAALDMLELAWAIGTEINSLESLTPLIQKLIGLRNRSKQLI